MAKRTLHSGMGKGMEPSDMEVYGSKKQQWVTLQKAASVSEGWFRSTKVMEIPGAGVLVQTSSVQRNQNGDVSMTDEMVFISDVKVIKSSEGFPMIVDDTHPDANPDLVGKIEMEYPADVSEAFDPPTTEEGPPEKEKNDAVPEEKPKKSAKKKTAKKKATTKKVKSKKD